MTLLASDLVSGADPFSEELRVLHVLQPTEAGVWRYATAMAQYQSEQGWDVHLASPIRPSGSYRWHHWPAQRSPARGVRSEAAAIRRITNAVDPDVVVAHSSKAGLIVRLALRGSRPTLFLPHAWSFAALSGPMAVAAAVWERFAMRYTSAVVGVGAKEIERGIAHRIYGPYFLVLNPVLPTWEKQSSTMIDGVTPDAVCVGRLSRQKGVDVLLAAWDQVRTQLPDAELLIVGDGPERDALELVAGGGVTFVGQRDNPRSYVEAAPVCVIPSRWEGLSLFMLEAMWSGRSLVITDVDGSEVVRQAGGGTVVPVEDARALAQALVDRLTDPRLVANESENSARHAREHHDFQACANRLSAVIARAYAFGGARVQSRARARRLEAL